ncbi:g4291 [Coccomyxa elongata]
MGTVSAFFGSVQANPLLTWRDHGSGEASASTSFQTASLSVGVGTACTVYKPVVVLEALALTAAIVLGLTAYNFHAVRKDYSFQRLGPILCAALTAMVLWSIIQVAYGGYVGGPGEILYALLGAIVFSGYIVFDIEN